MVSPYPGLWTFIHDIDFLRLNVPHVNLVIPTEDSDIFFVGHSLTERSVYQGLFWV